MSRDIPSGQLLSAPSPTFHPPLLSYILKFVIQSCDKPNLKDSLQNNYPEIFEIISVARKLGKTLAEEKAEIERRNVMGETV